jgi:hypothetical protein
MQLMGEVRHELCRTLLGPRRAREQARVLLWHRDRARILLGGAAQRTNEDVGRTWLGEKPKDVSLVHRGLGRVDIRMPCEKDADGLGRSLADQT